MTRLAINLAINTIAVWVGTYLLKGVHVDGLLTALVVAVVLGIINTFLKPVLIFLTLPITVVTFGLFLLVINALMILLTDKLVAGFEVQNFWWALLFSFVVSIVNAFLNSLS